MNLNYTLTKKELLSGQLDNVHNSIEWRFIDAAVICFAIPLSFIIVLPFFSVTILHIFINTIMNYCIYKYFFKLKYCKNVLNKKNINISEKENLEFSWNFDENSISIYQNRNNISFQWSDILKIIDTKEYIQFYTPMKEKLFIPKKKAFNNINELESFYSFLKSNCPENIFTTHKKACKIPNVFKEYYSRKKYLNM